MDELQTLINFRRYEFVQVSEIWGIPSHKFNGLIKINEVRGAEEAMDASHTTGMVSNPRDWTQQSNSLFL